MASNKKRFFATLLVFTSLVSGIAQAQYSAYAVGSDGKGSWATMKTQAEANWEALKKCNEGYPKKDCELKLTKAIVLVHNPVENFGGYVPISTSVEDGNAYALKLCNKPDCRIEKVFTTPGFWALARSKNKEGQVESYLAHGYDNFDEVREEAIKRCQKLTDFQCERTASGVIAGEQKPNAKSVPQKK